VVAVMVVVVVVVVAPVEIGVGVGAPAVVGVVRAGWGAMVLSVVLLLSTVVILLPVGVRELAKKSGLAVVGASWLWW